MSATHRKKINVWTDFRKKRLHILLFFFGKIRNVKEYQPHPSNKTHIGVSHLFAEASRWTSGCFLKPACPWFDSRQVAVTRDIPTRFSLCIFLESNRS